MTEKKGDGGVVGMAKAGYNSKCDVAERVGAIEAERLPYETHKHDCWNVRAEYFALRCSSNDFHNPLHPQEAETSGIRSLGHVM